MTKILNFNNQGGTFNDNSDSLITISPEGTKVEQHMTPSPSSPQMVNTGKAQYRLAPDMIGHVAKIIAAMYDNKMFVKENGTPATNVEDLAHVLGAAFGEDFRNWRQTLSAAIEQQNCLDIFNDLQHKIKLRKQKKM